MPNQPVFSVENNFTKGLITEFTGLNFPANAATDADNVVFEITGEVTRRLGVNKEINGTTFARPRANLGLSDYKWDNAGGDGNTQLVVRQIGFTLYFYKSSSASANTPLSTQLLSTTVDMSSLEAVPGILDATKECQYADGNGYLIVYHPDCDPFYCVFNPSFDTVTANRIPIRIRDLVGVPEPGIDDNIRPSAPISAQHLYNLVNQGWVQGNAWQANSTDNVLVGNGAKVFTVAASLGATPGQVVSVTAYSTGGIGVPRGIFATMNGTVTSYAGTTLTLSITSFTGSGTYSAWTIVPISTGYVDTWHSVVGNYPSNADQWWTFKNASGVFDPATTNNNVTLSAGPAPKGHTILSAFDQQRSPTSGVAGITPITTGLRPRTGCWFAGRTWFTGVDASFGATGNAPFTTWTENIYFSQIINSPVQFGNCYQQNDPTAEDLFDLLPNDGGVITIGGSGSIYKLFPIQNGLLVFAANGIWFITGSQGIGFAANDYTITKISSVQSISSTSFVNVQGLPYFWNEEGIYTVQPSQGGGLEVNPITVGTILSLYAEIPRVCKALARGAYDPINYTIQWVYGTTISTDVTIRYTFDKMLTYNNYNKAFYTDTIDTSNASINGILYVTYPGGGAGTPAPAIKFPSSYNGASNVFYAEEYDSTYQDWAFTGTPVNYESFFVTGYSSVGQAIRRFQLPYIYTYSINDVPTTFYIQGIWDFAASGDTGRWSNRQRVENFNPNYINVSRRHTIRGHGKTLQLKISSVDNKPFGLIGWAIYETQNTGI